MLSRVSKVNGLNPVRDLLALLLAGMLCASPVYSQSSIDERPNAFAMTGDLLVGRPLGAAITAVGAAAFVVSLPFTIMGGAVSESAETLVLGPAEATFVRCLGCLVAGYSYKDMERRRERRERAAAMAEGR